MIVPWHDFVTLWAVDEKVPQRIELGMKGHVRFRAAEEVYLEYGDCEIVRADLMKAARATASRPGFAQA